MTIALVTDSTATLPAALAASAGVDVVPLHVVIGAETYVDGHVTSEMVADALRRYLPVSTSRPTPEQFAAAYLAAAEAGATSVVSVHLSARVSGTYDAALLGAKSSPVPVEVVDSQQVGMATAFAVLRAARARDEGADTAAVAEAAREAGRRSTSLLYVDTLEHLKRGGRVGAASAFLGTALAVKPLLTIGDGLLQPLEKVRTSSRALSRLDALARAAAEGYPEGCDIGVQHLGAESEALDIARRLSAGLDRDDVHVAEVSAVLGAHVGPGLVAVSLTPR